MPDYSVSHLFFFLPHLLILPRIINVLHESLAIITLFLKHSAISRQREVSQGLTSNNSPSLVNHPFQSSCFPYFPAKTYSIFYIDSYLSVCLLTVMKSKLNIKTTESAAALTELILESFRFHGQLVIAGDQLTKELGLTAALWQVLGAIDEASLSMAQIARIMGLTRQSVRRSIQILVEKGLVEFYENPDHRRAKLAVLTMSGRTILNQVRGKYTDWSNRIAKDLSKSELTAATKVLSFLQKRF
jgi:DNA-binding MarR family transcriptional regulator